MPVRRLGHDRAEEKCAQRERVTRELRDHREAEQQAGEPKGLHLLVRSDAHPLQEPGHEQQTADAGQHHEGPELQQRFRHRRPAALAEVDGRVEEGEHHHRHDVLEHRHPHRQLARAFVVRARFLQDLGDDRRRRNHQHRREEQPLDRVPAQGDREESGQLIHQERAGRRRQHERRAEAAQLAQAQAEPDGEHQENQSDLRQRLDPLEIVHQRDRRRVRPDQHARREKPDDDREPDPLAKPARRAADDEDDREFLDEIEPVHTAPPQDASFLAAVKPAHRMA